MIKGVCVLYLVIAVISHTTSSKQEKQSKNFNTMWKKVVNYIVPYVDDRLLYYHYYLIIVHNWHGSALPAHHFSIAWIRSIMISMVHFAMPIDDTRQRFLPFSQFIMEVMVLHWGLYVIFEGEEYLPRCEAKPIAFTVMMPALFVPYALMWMLVIPCSRHALGDEMNKFTKWWQSLYNHGYLNGIDQLFHMFIVWRLNIVILMSVSVARDEEL